MSAPAIERVVSALARLLERYETDGLWTVVIYDPQADQWYTAGPFPKDRALVVQKETIDGFAVEDLADCRVYLARHETED